MFSVTMSFNEKNWFYVSVIDSFFKVIKIKGVKAIKG